MVLDGQVASAQQIGKLFALAVVEEVEGALEGGGDGLLDTAGAVGAALCGVADLGFVEGRAEEGVSEGADGAAVIDLGLSALGLEVVEDGGQGRGLLIGEVEAARHKTQRTTHTPRAAAAAVVFLAMAVAVGLRAAARVTLLRGAAVAVVVKVGTARGGSVVGASPSPESKHGPNLQLACTTQTGNFTGAGIERLYTLNLPSRRCSGRVYAADLLRQTRHLAPGHVREI